MIGRRGFLLGAVGAASVALIGGCGDGDVTGIATSGSFRSRFRHTDVGWTIVRPAGHEHDRLPVLVALHAREGDHTGVFAHSMHLDQTLAAVVATGTKPFAIAAADGGHVEYWHPRRTTDPAGMIVHEFLPLLAQHNLDVGRIGLMGWSMGGYGALYLGTVLGRERVAAVVAESPAMWHTAGQQVEGSFDDNADFDRHAILPRARALDGIPTKIDCGADDGFRYVVTDLRARLHHPAPVGGIEPGGHTTELWRSQAPSSLRFVGAQL